LICRSGHYLLRQAFCDYWPCFRSIYGKTKAKYRSAARKGPTSGRNFAGGRKLLVLAATSTAEAERKSKEVDSANRKGGIGHARTQKKNR
jgi:hypothetical protein